jgi:hypothetical protein
VNGPDRYLTTSSFCIGFDGASFFHCRSEFSYRKIDVGGLVRPLIGLK